MPDVIVVGAGSAGCALAGRLAGRGVDVLLLEAGPGLPLGAHRVPSAPPVALQRPAGTAPGEMPAEVRDAASLAATVPGHPRNWAHPAVLRADQRVLVPRGRGVGGSSAINGANWVRATPADADAWGPGWTWADLLPFYAASETDLDFGGGPAAAAAPLHGARGPIAVRRPTGDLLHPAAGRMLIAAEELGHPAEPDKNAGGPPGYGPVPSNAADGVRVNAALAYLAAYPHVVRPDAPVESVVIRNGRATGVRLEGGEVIGAGEVVLAAGAVGSPRLLLRSGVGPADELRAAGIDVLVDLPVGRDWSDHPSVYVPFGPPAGAVADPPAHPHAPGGQAALNLDAGADPAGDVEVLAFVRPFVPGGPLHLMCALQAPDSRGVLTLDRIEYRYLRTEHDRRRLRHAIRTAAELLRAGTGERVAPGGDVLGVDRVLDGWIAAHLTTSVHLCGSAGIGRVVDAELRVLGVDGLRVADTSVLPTVPRRGPGATAVAIGEKAAALLTTRR